MSVRPAALQDLPVMLDIYAPYVENTTFSLEYTVPTPEEFRNRFLTYTKTYPWLVWEEDGQVIGYAYASPMAERMGYRWNADMSVYVRTGHHGGGIGRQLYEAMESILGRLGYCNVYAIITGENPMSLAFHEHRGYSRHVVMEKSGYKFGRWVDVHWMCKPIREYEPDSPPRPWDGKL